MSSNMSAGGVTEAAGQAVRGHRPGGDGEVLDGPLDAQPAAVYRVDMRLVGVAQQDVVAVPDEVGADGPADGPGADDRQLHGSALPGGAGQGGTERVLGHPGGVGAEVADRHAVAQYGPALGH
jgi:hypothetical protein